MKWISLMKIMVILIGLITGIALWHFTEVLIWSIAYFLFLSMIVKLWR